MVDVRSARGRANAGDRILLSTPPPIYSPPPWSRGGPTCPRHIVAAKCRSRGWPRRPEVCDPPSGLVGRAAGVDEVRGDVHRFAPALRGAPCSDCRRRVDSQFDEAPRRWVARRFQAPKWQIVSPIRRLPFERLLGLWSADRQWSMVWLRCRRATEPLPFVLRPRNSAAGRLNPLIDKLPQRDASVFSHIRGHSHFRHSGRRFQGEHSLDSPGTPRYFLGGCPPPGPERCQRRPGVVPIR